MARSCDRIVHTLRQKGIRIDVIHFTPPRPGRPWQWEVRQGGEDLVCHLKLDRPHTLNLLWQHIKDRLYHAVVAFGDDTPLYAAPAYAAWWNVPLAVCLRGNDWDTGLFSAKKRPQLLEAVRAADAVASVSSEKLPKVKALAPDVPVVFTPNGIDLAQWRVFSDQQAETRANGRLVLGLFGNLKAKKGLAFLVDALLRTGTPNEFHLLIVGTVDEGSLAGLLRHQMALSFELIPECAHAALPPLMASCDYVVIPSFYDGMPNTLLEAGGLGVPVLCSDAGGMPDVVSDLEHGFLFPAADLDGCTEVLNNALQTREEEREEQGTRLREHIATHFTVDREAEHFIALLNDLETQRNQP